jgi:sugar/nucleoside kinase (ribokinase family)
MPHVICIGHLNVEDTAYPGRPLVHRAPGGAALYAAAAARLWGLQVSLVSRIGNDYPVEYLGAMQAAGLNLEGIRMVEGPTMAGRTQYTDDGDRQYQMYTPAARRLAITPEPADIGDRLIESAQGVHLATMPPSYQGAWLAALRARVDFISLDTDVSFIRREPEEVTRLLAQVDAFLPSRAEAEAFHPDLTLAASAERLAALGPPIVVIKCGPGGAHLYLRETRQHIHILSSPAQVVDVTGAGDAFCGGFVAGYLESADVRRAGWQGTVAAALAIEDYGALHLLQRTRAEAKARLRIYIGEIH